MSYREENEIVEIVSRELLARFSDRMSMDETRDCAYAVAAKMGGQVVLTMSREDFEILLVLLGVATGSFILTADHNRVLALLNRLNEGNPHYTPYRVAPDRNEAPLSSSPKEP